ncbi:virulence-associated E family protein [Clostridium sp. DL1XJH146]
MKLNNDGFINIATGKSRRTIKWTNKKLFWSAFLDRISKTVRTGESYEEYGLMTKKNRDDKKDVGGFVGGKLKDGRRRKEQVEFRQLVTLDADYVKGDIWASVEFMIGSAAAIYSTHSHSNNKPRMRIIIPLKRPVSADEYGAVSRKIAEDIGIEFFDGTTFEPHRLMYWPSTCSDGEFVFKYLDEEWVDPDEVLSRYEDWRDQATWPEGTKASSIRNAQIKKQMDPREKSGFIGAFCRSYSVLAAIEKFLKDVYKPVNEGTRYTYVKGSSVGGLIIYEQGKFAYSHHSTDPASGILCNSFDLVRIHKFGHLDQGQEEAKQKNRLPSFKAMIDFCKEDKETKLLLVEEKTKMAREEFARGASLSKGGIDGDRLYNNDETTEGSENQGTSNKQEVSENQGISVKQGINEEQGINEKQDITEKKKAVDADLSWLAELSISDKGTPNSTFANLLLILQNDVFLVEKIALNEFLHRPAVLGDLPWRTLEDGEYWQDRDDAELRGYIESVYDIVSPQKLNDALMAVQARNKFHPIKDYFGRLKWDGIARIETLFIDYLGAEDTVFNRCVTRKIMAAAVARVYEPGVKFDYILVLVGAQGIGKSYMIKKLGLKWHSDSVNTVQGKEAYEQLQGAWLIELAELSATRKAETEAVKHFISKQEDMYRVAYGKQVSVFKRQCVFFGTTNDNTFLRDKTGNRRFWPIVVGKNKSKKNLWKDLTEEEINQVWAEANELYKNHEPLYLENSMEKEATLVQEIHTEESAMSGVINEYLNMLLPSNWYDLDIFERRQYIQGSEFGEAKRGNVEREKVCAMEIWVEALGGDIKQMTRTQSREIIDIITKTKGWKSYDEGSRRLRFGKNYGVQRAFVRIRD